VTPLWDLLKRLVFGELPESSSQGGSTPTAPTSASPAPGGASARPARDPFAAGGILGLSVEELRERALRINPFRTPWIGRVDTIPPASDARTALVDRGLVLRGLLTQSELVEIHRVGDLWLRFSDRVRAAEAVGAGAAEAAVERLERERDERRVEKRRLAEARRRERAEAIERRKAEEVLHLGRGVSSRLAHVESRTDELERRGLPVFSTPLEVADAMGLPLSRLRWLCYHAEAIERPHYAYFEIPKRSGGTRTLAAPQPVLAAAQRWLLEDVLAHLPVEEPAHGFVRGRSTVSNAEPHCGRDVVVNQDLSDFFPTITFRRVRGLFESLGYSGAVATVFALLATESSRVAVEYDGARYWAAVGERVLPQGAPTSPAISNQIARRLDRRLAGAAAAMGWRYTRYADDLTFSAPEGKRGEVARLLARVRHVVEEEGFAINPKKGRVQRRGGRQLVTGIVVNERPHVAREEVRRLRAILHGAKRTGLEAQNREGRPNFEAWLRGKLAYLAMVDRERGARMLAELDLLVGDSGG
jgi:retron-type reverse transcriptase